MKSVFSVFSLFILLVGTGAVVAKSGHLTDVDCTQCHLTRGDITSENAYILVASQEDLCESCHNNALTASHPTGIKPSQSVPDEFPLDWKGELTCSTCHSVHGTSAGLLRIKRQGKHLCLSCHDQAFFDNMMDGGSSVMAFGHIDARISLEGNIDSFSVNCLSCHDSLGGDLNVSLSEDVIRHNSGRFNHPIGMIYQNISSFGGYLPIDTLSSVIVLPDGKVSCLSCHQGYSNQHGKLVANYDGSELCYLCHDI